MSNEKQRFTIRATASRLEKGLLAVPQEFTDWFPGEKGQIQVVFDDEEKTKTLTFHSYDPIVKENRIFGLGQWMSKRGVREGYLISITLEDPNKRLYRIALDRYVQERVRICFGGPPYDCTTRPWPPLLNQKRNERAQEQLRTIRHPP